MTIREWLTDLVSDPDGSASSARVCATLCALTGCGIAIASVFTHHDMAATVASLVGGGASSLFSRVKSQ